MATDSPARRPNGSNGGLIRAPSHAAQEGPGGSAAEALAGCQLEQAASDAQDCRLRYQELFDFSPNGYAVTDLHGVIVEVNHAAASMLGCGKQFLIGKPLAFFFDGGDRRDFYKRLCELDTRPREARLRFNGVSRDVMLSATPRPASGEQSAALRWVLQDVGRARRAESALRSETGFADSLVAATQAIVLVVTASGRVLRSNPYLHEISGYPDSEVCSRQYAWHQLLIDRPEWPDAVSFLRLALDTGSARDYPLTLVTHGGQRRSVRWSARLFEALEGAAVALVGHDITELREAQRQAVDAERLAAVGRTAAAVAHEGRNALQRAQSCLTLLGFRLEGQPEALELLGRLQQAQDDLYHLLEDVRGFASPVRLDRRVCYLNEVWREAWKDLAVAREAKTAELYVKVEAKDCSCTADPYRLKQVFRNLLENALSAGRPPVAVEIHCTEANVGGRAALRVSVRDNGPGFTDEQRRRAFEPFFTTKQRGTGLGLAICRRIVEAHGGRVELGIGPPPGAEVIVFLPRSLP